MQMLVAALVASLCICCAVALQCKQCMQVTIKTDNDDAKQALQFLSAISNEKCANRAGEAGVETMMCPSAPEGLKAVCTTMSIGGTFKVPNNDISVGVMQYQRACQVAPAGEAATGECKDLDKKVMDEVKKAMGEQMADAYSDMSGKVCNCEGDDCNTGKAPPVVLAAGESQNGASQNVAVLSASLLMCLVHLLF